MIGKISHEDLLLIINRLDQSIYNHQQWFNALIRTLICKLPPDQHDMHDQSYKGCRFGQWYYSENAQDLREHPGFKAIGDEHMRLHQLTTNLLNTMTKAKTISPPDYDNFSNALDRFRLEISALRRELENLLYNRDPLTGSTNRISMLPILREQQEISKRENQTCCIVMMDLDGFKKINDTHGHPVGDNVLKAAAQFVIQYLRPYDKVFRYGGEEFLIYLHNIPVQSAKELVEKLAKEFSETTIITEPPLHISASFGLTLLDVYSPIEQSVERADKAMMEGKSKGGNCVQVWNG